MSNFWLKLPKPFLVLAPMEGVTDYVFREIVSQIAKPDVFFTEFTSADGLFSKGQDVVIRKLKYSQKQRPIVAQIWGKNADNLFRASQLVRDLKFDGVDINMGCPDRSIVKHGAGSGLIGNNSQTKEIISAVKKGAGKLPVSIKTRLGLDTVITEEWIGFLLEQNINALTIHGRTARQMSKGDASWQEIGKAVKIRDKISPNTVLIGNGDVKSYKQTQELHKIYGLDGIMIGRGVFTNPWIFAKTTKNQIHQRGEYIEILSRHLLLQDKIWKGAKNFDIMKKFFKMYVKDFAGASELRQQLMESKNSQEVKEILSKEVWT